MNWVTIDFEASCLPRHGHSFPIEVGVCGPLGTCSWLIKPVPEWHEWDWTCEAFALHGIERGSLDEQGLDPKTVIAKVQQATRGARVIADSPIDLAWWQTLLDAAQPTIAAAPMIIEQIGDVFDELGATPEQIEFARRSADRLGLERHRAGTDARWLFALLSTLSERTAADRDEATRKSFPNWTSKDAYWSRRREPQPVKG